ncbi:hypothetical protein [Variovorax sp. GT1P44]
MHATPAPLSTDGYPEVVLNKIIIVLFVLLALAWAALIWIAPTLF